jgi:hypothetical protein
VSALRRTAGARVITLERTEDDRGFPENQVMKARLGFVLLALVSAAPVVLSQPATPFAAVAPAVQAFVDKGEVAGVVTLIAKNDKVIHLTAVGKSDLSTGRVMRTDDLFWIA